jgi:hypothetical protein
MRVVEPDDRQATSACGTSRIEMRLRIDQKIPCGIVGEIRRGQRIHNLVRRAEQQAAALLRRACPGVRVDAGERRPYNANGYRASTAIAMPMPPPMQSDAMP